MHHETRSAGVFVPGLAQTSVQDPAVSHLLRQKTLTLGESSSKETLASEPSPRRLGFTPQSSTDSLGSPVMASPVQPALNTLPSQLSMASTLEYAKPTHPAHMPSPAPTTLDPLTPQQPDNQLGDSQILQTGLDMAPHVGSHGQQSQASVTLQQQTPPQASMAAPPSAPTPSPFAAPSPEQSQQASTPAPPSQAPEQNIEQATQASPASAPAVPAPAIAPKQAPKEEGNSSTSTGGSTMHAQHDALEGTMYTDGTYWKIPDCNSGGNTYGYISK